VILSDDVDWPIRTVPRRFRAVGIHDKWDEQNCGKRGESFHWVSPWYETSSSKCAGLQNWPEGQVREGSKALFPQAGGFSE